MAVTAFYERSGTGELLPTELAAGPPWLPGTQHGSMVTALMARAADAAPAATPMRLLRLTVDLTRPVPSGPTTVDAVPVRDGRRLQALDLTLRVRGEVFARGTALRLRTTGEVLAPDAVPATWPDDHPGASPEGEAIESPLGPDPLWDAHSARWLDHVPGNAAVWLRPSLAIVDGEPLTPTARAALVADLTMTNGGLLSTGEYIVVNADLTMTLDRLPEGEWLLVRSRVRIGRDGTGVSEGTLFDRLGHVGSVAKCLLIDRKATS